MRRREFVAAIGAVPWLGARERVATVGRRGTSAGDAAPSEGAQGGAAETHAQTPRVPSLGPEVYGARRARAQELMAERRVDLLIATPGTNFQYLLGFNPGRSERLIALLLPRRGEPAIVAPSFELERVRRSSTALATHGWEEAEDPFALAARLVVGLTSGAGGTGAGGGGGARRPPRGPGEAGRGRRIALALEPSTEYQTYLRLEAALSGAAFGGGTELFRDLRISKQPEELTLIRAAVRITEDAIAATFAQLRVGLTDREVAAMVSREISQRGGSGGGLVQFGPTSALPHGGTEGRTLEPETPVLMDCGSRVEGYTSDITRTQWFGAEPSARFRQVYNTVHTAQTAAIALARPGVACQDLDRAARRVIREAGFGPFFTHRLGHGMGMEGHEPPYLVEGNALALRPGMVVTVEPGIYLSDEWGVRLEDDCVVTESGFEVLSRRAAQL